MKNNLISNSPSTQAVKFENASAFSDKQAAEEVILYDECGDTQWDKVLEQYDMADH